MNRQGFHASNVRSWHTEDFEAKQWTAMSAGGVKTLAKN